MLEILAVHEVLASLVSEKGATLISERTWWFVLLPLSPFIFTASN